jgi:hypothetical protein
MTGSVADSIITEYAGKYDPLITVEQAGEIAHVSPATVHGWSSAGQLDAFSVSCGRRVLFHRDAFVRFILERTTCKKREKRSRKLAQEAADAE